MTKSVLWMSALMFPLLASKVAADPGVNLRWNNCLGDGGVINRSFACNVNTLSQTLVGSFELASDFAQATGVVVTLDITASGATLPDWWAFKNPGTCRQNSMTVNTTVDPFAAVCSDWASGLAFSGFTYTIGTRGSNTARVQIQIAVPSANAQNLLAGVEYFAFNLKIDNLKTTGAGACSGCSTPVCIAVCSILVSSATQTVTLKGPTNGTDSNLATWQGGVPGGSCADFGAFEVCNGVDDDCDGAVDEGALSYRDADGDGYGNPSVSVTGCPIPAGYVSNASDCNDAQPAIHPGAPEACNGLDDDCDGQVDEGVKITFYLDADGDGFGTPTSTTQACTAPSGYVANSTDCDDTRASVYPGAPEFCDGLDNDCDGPVDEGALGPPGLVAWWKGEGNANDAVGTNHGTPQNGATFQAGKVGQCFSLDGVDDRVANLGTAPSFSFIQNTGVFTIEGWIRLDDPNAPRFQTISANVFNATQKGHIFGYENSLGQHQLEMDLANGSGSSVITSRSPVGVITDGLWHHVAAAGNGTNVTFYVDGVAHAGSGTMGTMSTGDATRAVDLGWDNVGSYFGGKLDEFALYNRALSASEIQGIYNAGSGGRCALVSVNEPRSLPPKLGVGRVRPNPASEGVDFEIQIPQVTTVNARVVDVTGRLVATLVGNGEMSAGSHRLRWNGRDASGKKVVPGIYLLRVVAGSGTAVQRIVMLK